MWSALGFMIFAGVAARVLEADVNWGGSTAADWFQAVGSVAAVGAAIFAAWTAGQQSRLAAKAEVVRTVELVCSIGYLMNDVCVAAFNELRNGSFLMPSNIDHVAGLFAAFPIDKYPSGEMALRLASVHRLTVGFGEAYFNTVAAIEGCDPRTGSQLIDSDKFEPPSALYQRTVEISAEYDQLVRTGQAILDRQPGRRVVIPAGRL